MSSFKRDTEVEIYCYVGKARDLYLFTNNEEKGYLPFSCQNDSWLTR